MAAVLLLGLGACAPAETNSGPSGAAGMAGRTDASGAGGRLAQAAPPDRSRRQAGAAPPARREEPRATAVTQRNVAARQAPAISTEDLEGRPGKQALRAGRRVARPAVRAERERAAAARPARWGPPDRGAAAARLAPRRAEPPAAPQGRAVGRRRRGGGAGGQLPPPVRDTASKVPISSASGYTVEGNYPYGPLTAQRLDVIYPSGAGPKGTKVLPAVLMFHGGGWIHSYTNNYGSGKDHMSTFFNRFLAHGFIVFNAEYRVNDGTADGAPAPAAVEDALRAAKWCWDYMDYFHADRSQLVVTGASAGGHLALMVAMTTPAAMLGPTSPTDYRIAGVVSGYGPADIEAEINAVAKDWIPATLPNRLAIAKLVNPQTYVRKDVPPLIVVQGALDNTAPVADSRRLVDRLVAAGADASMHEVPGAGHGFQTPATAWPDAEKAMFDWLVAHGIGK